MRITLERTEIHAAIQEYIRRHYNMKPHWSRSHLDYDRWYAEIECSPQSNNPCGGNSRCPNDTP